MNETDINAVSKKYTNINEQVKNALSDFDAEKAKAAHNKILKTRNDEAQITDTFNKIAHVMIIAGIILAALWIGSMLELGISSGWKSGEKHWVSVLYPIALLFHETALIYIAPLLVIVLAGGGYALMKYSNKRFDKAIKNYEKGASKILVLHGKLRDWQERGRQKEQGRLLIVAAKQTRRKSSDAPGRGYNNPDQKSRV